MSENKGTSAAHPAANPLAGVAMQMQSADEASTWKPADLVNDPSWQHRLTRAQVAELVDATVSAQARGLQVGEFTREQFPLPTVGKHIEALVDNVENGRGVSLLRGMPVDQYDDEFLRVMYWGFGVHAGKVISQNSKGQLLAEVSDRGNAYGDRNTRGFSTNAELSPHVDTSDMTTLLCVRTARSGGESRVVSSSTIYNAVLAEHPEYLDVLYRGFYNDLRGEGPTGDINELTHSPIPIYSHHAGRVSCSFNLRMIENAAVKRDQPFTPLERAALDCLRAFSLRDEYGYRFMMDAGDIQMVSNHSVFHARTDFVDFDEPARKRCLFRLWVNIIGGRELADNFSDRYNTGPRGGVAKGDGARYDF
jgi:hypothetical protein